MGDKKSRSKDDGDKPVAAPAPAAGFPALRDEMERMMKQFFADDWLLRMPRFAMPAEWPRSGAMQMPFAALMDSPPKADLSETADAYELDVELPGLDEKNIDLTLTDDTLVLKAEKRIQKESKEKDYHFTERSYGSIRRQFALPAGVDRDAMKATFSNGVLHVTLPKTAEVKSKPRRIQVSSA